MTRFEIAQSEAFRCIEKALAGKILDKEDVEVLFRVPLKSEAGYAVQYASRKISEKLSQGKAEIHGQVGINIGPCPKNCQFCSFAACNKVFPDPSVLPLEEIIRRCLDLEEAGANAIYLMTTANFSFERYVEIAHGVRNKLQKESVLVANVGDFTYEQALTLKNAGLNGVYHALRLGEGKTTGIEPERRLQSFTAAKEAGLILGNCVEPVGPEHTVEELVEKTLIAREASPVFSGAMRRITIPATPLSEYGMLSEARMAHILAVVRLAMGPSILGNCTHEPNVHGAVAGANLLWAEVGSNPRDVVGETQNHRGFSVERCREIYWDADWEVLSGPSQFFSKAQ
jgi:biotin synthase